MRTGSRLSLVKFSVESLRTFSAIGCCGEMLGLSDFPFWPTGAGPTDWSLSLFTKTLQPLHLGCWIFLNLFIPNVSLTQNNSFYSIHNYENLNTICILNKFVYLFRFICWIETFHLACAWINFFFFNVVIKQKWVSVEVVHLFYQGRTNFCDKNSSVRLKAWLPVQKDL